MSTLLSIGNVVTMLPTTKENFELNTDQVVKQIVIVPTPISLNQNSIEQDGKAVAYEALAAQSTKDELLSIAKGEASTTTQATIKQTEDSKIELSVDVEPPTDHDIDMTSPRDIFVEDDKNDLIRNTENDLFHAIDKTVTQQTNDLEAPTIADLQKREDTEIAKDSLVAALQQYRTQESTKTVIKEFIIDMLDLLKAWMESAAATLSNDPVMISTMQYMKDSTRNIEISVQIVNDRLPSDSQPFVKGFLVGTLLLNVFNEGQKYKEDVYTLHSDEKVNTKIVNNETDVPTSEQQMIFNETDFAIAQPWIEEIGADNTLQSLDNEKEAVADEVQALAEVLITKKIVKELLQKKKEKKDPFFASSIIAIADQQNSPLPQAPMEKPPIELFDANVVELVDKSKRKTDDSNFAELSGGNAEQLISSRDASPSWAVPFLRNFANNSRDEKYVPMNSKGAELNTNAFILWMQKIAKSLTAISTEKALDTTSEMSSLVNPSQFQTNQFKDTKEGIQMDSWSKQQTYNVKNDFSADYDFTSPSKVEKIFDSDDFVYGKTSAQDEASRSAEIIDDFVEQDNSSIDVPIKAKKIETESFRSYNMPPMQVNIERQGSEQLESRDGERMAPFNIPVSDDSAKSGPRWPPPTKRTSYSSIGEGYGGKDESKTVEFNAPFDTYEYQYARYGGNMPGNDSAGTAFTEPPSKFEFTPPDDYEATFSALNIYSSQPTPDLESKKVDLTNVKPPGQPTFVRSNNNGYTEKSPISNNETGEPRKFEFPTTSNFAPTFSALSIYGGPSTESPPEADSNLDTKFQLQESVEPTFNALNIYSVAPESNDVPRVSNPEKLYSSVEAQPVRDPLNEYSNSITKNQENATPGTVDSESSSEPSFSLADLFNEATTVQDADKYFESQEAVNIPIADVLPPSFQVDIEVADGLQTNPYNNVNMFSILPDMNDIFSAKPSYNPYPTHQPDILEANDMRKDAIDTPIDTNPTYHDKNDSLYILPQELSIPTNSNESRTLDLPNMNQDTESPESRKAEHEEVNDLAIHVKDSPVVINPTNSENGTALVSPQVPSSSNRSTIEDLPSAHHISKKLPVDEKQRREDNAIAQAKQIADNPIIDRVSFPGQFDSTIQSTEEVLQAFDSLPKAEFPSTSLNSERSNEKETEKDGANDLKIQDIETPINPNTNSSNNSDSLISSFQVNTSSKSFSIDSTSSDVPSSKTTETNESEYDVDTSIVTNPMIQDTGNFSVSPQEPEKTDVSSTQRDSETLGDNENIWDDEPFQ